MIEGLIRFGVRNRVPVTLVMWALVLGGIWSALTMRREFFPEVDPDAAQVVLSYAGASPAEIEESLARKVEDAVATIASIDEMLNELSLLSGPEAAEGAAATTSKDGKPPDAVTLSSVHQAKGLEWKVVFLVWLAEGQFPNGRILESDDHAMLEEERR